MLKYMRWLFRTFYTLLLFGSILFIGYLILTFSKDLAVSLPNTPLSEKAIERKLQKEAKSWKNLQFELVDPEQAPPEIRQIVEVGYRLMLHTHELLPDNVDNRLDCSNCHFAGGISSGGVNGGISLAGVAAQYPKYDSRTKKVEDLPTRINSCFMNSMNGKPLNVESKEMLALVTYMHWISLHYPIYGGSPWLGVKPLRTTHAPNAQNGEKLYTQYCADCHGGHGEGSNESKNHPGKAIPPLWGEHSFNSSAGMDNPETFASFIYHNMPYDDTNLLVDEAVDIAAFVTSQPRPAK